MPTVSIVDTSVYANDANKPTDGQKLLTDLQAVFAEVNAKETRIANLESNSMTIGGTKSFSGTIKVDTITEFTTNNGTFINNQRIQNGYCNTAAVRVAIASVDPATDIITCSAVHSLTTGNRVRVRAIPGSTVPSGTSTSTIYFSRAVTTTTLTLHTTLADALANTNIVNITGTGTGTMHLIAEPTPTYEGDLWAAYTLKCTINGNDQEVVGGRGHIVGLNMATSAGTPNTTVDIPAGSVWDSTGVVRLKLTSTLSKRNDAVYANGTGNGGMDTGTKSASQSLFIYLIGKGDGTTDAVFSASASAPTLPSGFVYYAYIGCVLTDGSSNNRPFFQIGNEFYLKDPILDLNAVTDTTTAASRTLTVPVGITVKALLNAKATNAADFSTLFSSLSVNDDATSATANVIGQLVGATGTGTRCASGQVEVWTNTAAQVRTRSSAAATTLTASTIGWLDPRGTLVA